MERGRPFFFVGKKIFFLRWKKKMERGRLFAMAVLVLFVMASLAGRTRRRESPGACTASALRWPVLTALLCVPGHIFRHNFISHTTCSWGELLCGAQGHASLPGDRTAAV
jgi:hypothetical protein